MPHKEKLNYEAKVEIVRRCISGEIGVNEAGREVGVGSVTIRRWLARYESEGAEGFLPQEQNRLYSPELKLQAVLEYQKEGCLLP